MDGRRERVGVKAEMSGTMSNRCRDARKEGEIPGYLREFAASILMLILSFLLHPSLYRVLVSGVLFGLFQGLRVIGYMPVSVLSCWSVVCPAPMRSQIFLPLPCLKIAIKRYILTLYSQG
ncbi:hypothetical protein HOY80DRAFT_732314 [Tuber brumale]|nr:hypothetical protein HOY80DRAFT_732314 [Tuber brumale]